MANGQPVDVIVGANIHADFAQRRIHHVERLAHGIERQFYPEQVYLVVFHNDFALRVNKYRGVVVAAVGPALC